MEYKLYYAPVEHPRCGDDLEHAWKYAVRPYKTAPHVWQVGGQDDVCAYLLDCGNDELMLIDTGYRASFYLLLNSIWEAGYNPRNIKKILLSHWHWDHVNGARYLQELSGCEVWISEADEEQHQIWKDDTSELPMVDFDATNFYDDSKTVDLGRFSVHTRKCPGHTPGSTTFWFEDTDDVTGETFRLAMHGGIGAFAMNPKFIADKPGLGTSEEMAHQFIRDCEDMAENWPITIALPSHLNQGNVKPNIPEDRTDYRVWIDDGLWARMLHTGAEAVKKFYPEIYS